jgi:hypothetical protein
LILTRQVGNGADQPRTGQEGRPTDPEHLVVGVIAYNLLGAGRIRQFDGGRNLGRTEAGPYFQGLAPLGDPW